MNIDYAHQYNLSLNHVGQGKVRIVFIWLCAGAIYLNLYIPMYFTSYDKYSSSLLVLVDDLRSVFGFSDIFRLTFFLLSVRNWVFLRWYSLAMMMEACLP